MFQYPMRGLLIVLKYQREPTSLILVWTDTGLQNTMSQYIGYD